MVQFGAINISGDSMQTTLRVILALSLTTLVLCSWLAPFDATAIKQIDTGLNRAMISYATARTLNAAISVAQGTEVAVEPGGVGINFTPGQALDPINDLVEQFSTLMLVACVAFGVQKILIGIGGFWLVSLMLTLVVSGWMWFYFRQQKPPIRLTKILVILLMIRFAIPLVTFGTDQLFNEFLSSGYKASQQVIDVASVQIAEINPSDPPLSADQGFIGSMKEKVNSLWSKTREVVDVKMHYIKLKQTAEQWASHIINLIVIFLLQTLIIPALLVWVLYVVARSAFESPVKISDNA
jgi:hypothetical protein